MIPVANHRLQQVPVGTDLLGSVFFFLHREIQFVLGNALNDPPAGLGIELVIADPVRRRMPARALGRGKRAEVKRLACQLSRAFKDTGDGANQVGLLKLQPITAPRFGKLHHIGVRVVRKLGDRCNVRVDPGFLLNEGATPSATAHPCP